MFIFKRAPRTFRVSKAAENPTLRRFNEYLDKTAPGLVQFLQNFWGDQGQAITYKELREAALNGWEPLIRQWQEDYARFIEETMTPVWTAAMSAAAAQLIADKKLLLFDSTERAVQEAIRTHGAEFLTACTETVRSAVRDIVQRGQYEGWSSDELGRNIRATVGLTVPQARANINYRGNRLTQLLADHPRTPQAKLEAQADADALKYAARQHRYRAQLIADTELAWAYNRGYHESVRQAMAQGLMGVCVKVWSTASDERTCVSCGALHNREVGFDDRWSSLPMITWSSKGEGLTPPAHPGCRCTIIYKETTAPRFRNTQAMSATPTSENPWPSSEGRQPIDKETLKELKTLAKSYKIELKGFERFDGDVGLIKETIINYGEFIKQYPKMLGERRGPTLAVSYNMSPNDYAEYTKRCITINGEAFRSRSVLAAEYQKDVLARNFVDGSTYKNIIYHELGHFFMSVYKIDPLRVLHAITGLKGKELINYIFNELSGYAASRKGELAAEVFSDLATTTPSAFSLKFYAECIRMVSKL